MAAKPTLAGVLGSVVRGRVVRLSLEPEQKRALRDQDGKLALDVLRHLLGARAENGAPKPFPLTEQTFQAVASRLAYRVGIKKARALRRRLVEAEVIRVGGSYRQPYRNRPGGSGFRVLLYRLVSRLRRPALSRKRLSAGFSTSSPRVRVRWWKHPSLETTRGVHRPSGLRAVVRRRPARTNTMQGFGSGLTASHGRSTRPPV